MATDLVMEPARYESVITRQVCEIAVAASVSLGGSGDVEPCSVLGIDGLMRVIDGSDSDKSQAMCLATECSSVSTGT